MYWYLTSVNRLNLNYLYEVFKDMTSVLAAIPSCPASLQLVKKTFLLLRLMQKAFPRGGHILQAELQADREICNSKALCLVNT